MSDLGIIPTDDLIEEIFKRKTFIGVLVYSPESHKFDNQHHSELRLYTTVERGNAIQLLENGINSLNDVLEDNK